jgi:hypothetical protein
MRTFEPEGSPVRVSPGALVFRKVFYSVRKLHGLFSFSANPAFRAFFKYLNVCEASR